MCAHGMLSGKCNLWVIIMCRGLVIVVIKQKKRYRKPQQSRYAGAHTEDC